MIKKFSSKKDNKITDNKHSGMNNMTDEEIISKIRKETDNLKIPDELSPKKMMEKIQNANENLNNNNIEKNIKRKKERNLHRRKWELLIASLLIVTMSATAFAGYMYINSHDKQDDTNTKYTNTNIEVGDYKKVNSQKELVKLLKNSAEHYDNTKYLGTGDIEIEESDDMVTNDKGAFNESVPGNIGSSTVKTDEIITTNEAVEGVSEADVLKSDGKYIYFLSADSSSIKVVSTDNGNLKNESSIDINKDIKNVLNKLNIKYNVDSMEFYLINDKLVLTFDVSELLLEKNSDDSDLSDEDVPVDDILYESRERETYIFVYDVNDKNNIKLENTLYQDGELVTSRVNGNKLYIVSSNSLSSFFDSNIYKNNKEDYDYILPYINGKPVKANDIFLGDDDVNYYTLITSVDINNSQNYLDSIVIGSSSSDIYVSKNNIYLKHNYSKKSNTNDKSHVAKYTNHTKISRISYSDGKLDLCRKQADIEGNAYGDFNVDEYNDVIRVLSTKSESYSPDRDYFSEIYTSMYSYVDEKDKNDYDEMYIELDYAWEACNTLNDVFSGVTNEIYTLNMDMEQIGYIGGLAKDETIYGARFMGNYGYFITYRNMDPLFAVDFTNPNSPQVVSELKMTGFSSYLHFWNKDILFGLGYETDQIYGGSEGIKLSMYDISNPENVSEVTRCIVGDEDSYTQSAYMYKGLLISPEKNIIGFSEKQYLNNKTKAIYNIYSYNENGEFVNQFSYSKIYDYDHNYLYSTDSRITFSEIYNNSEMRGIYINNILYIIESKGVVTAFNMDDDYTQISSINFN